MGGHAWWVVVTISLAGGVGAATRYLVDSAVTARVAGAYPWGTTVVNVTGAFWIGVFIGSAGTADPWRAVVGIGLLGGYTTLSATSLETVHLLESRRFGPAVGSGLGMLAAAVVAAAIGGALSPL